MVDSGSVIELTGFSFSSVLVAPLASLPLQVALPGTYNQPGYTGIVNSNQHLVNCDSSFNVQVPRYSHFMRVVNPLSVFKRWCNLQSTHRRYLYFSNHFQCLTNSLAFRSASLVANATIMAASLFGQSVSGWTRSSPNPAFSCADGIQNRSL